MLLLLRRGERAELALHAADVRLVQVEVLDEVDLVVPPRSAARPVGELAEPEQVVGLEQREPVLEVEPLAGLDLLPDRLERGCAVKDGHERFPVHDGVGERLELLPVGPAVQAFPRLSSVVERHLPGALERAGRGDAHERALDRPARERRAHRRRPRARRAGAAASASPSRRSVPATLPVSIVSPEQSRMSSAIWKAMPSLRPKRPSVPPEPSEQAASKSFAGLERAAFEVRLHRRVGIVALAPLHRLAAREAERGVCEHGDGASTSPSAASSANARAKR